MAIISTVGRGLDLASQLAIDVRDARAIEERARAAEEARAAADQRSAQRTIADEVSLLDARRRAALQEQAEAEREQAAELAAALLTSANYTRPPGLSLRYQTPNPVAAPAEQSAIASTPAFESRQASGTSLADLAAIAAYQQQVAAGTDAASSVRVRA